MSLPCSVSPAPVQASVTVSALWICRALVAQPELLDSRAALLGVARRLLDGWPELHASGEGAPILRRLQALLPQLETHAAPSPALRANIGRLAEVFGFSPLERQVLELAVLLQTDALLQTFASALGEQDGEDLQRLLTAMLSVGADALTAALSPAARLQGSGLLDVREGPTRLPVYLSLLSSALARDLATPEADPLAALRDTIVPSPAPTLTLADYRHLGGLLDVAVQHLRGALAQHRPGVNVLLYGPPGTGKTELSRVLGAALDCGVYALPCADRDGQPIGGTSRLRRLRAAQALVSRQPALLVFDELDDVLHDDAGLRRPPPGSAGLVRTLKSWMNLAVETNPVPTIWICNDINALDPAFVRRFDVVLELPTPPRAVRRTIIERACVGLADADTVQALAAKSALTPAVVTRAARVIGGVQRALGDTPPATALRALIDGTLRAQGHAVPRRSRAEPAFDPRWVNTEADVVALAEGIARAGQARLCLDGPPGTGKTAFAHWLARRLDRPLHLHRTSDLLSSWVGGTEKALAAAFNRAEDDGAVLLIDEVDSLLADRDGARQNWEVSQVNELLTQIDGFAGVFVATTNRVHGIDPAALRRFDVKLSLRPLREEQAWALYQTLCQRLGLAADGDARATLAQLDGLTPGDFAVVERRAKLLPVSSARQLLDALAAERRRRPAAPQGIGFVAPTRRVAPLPEAAEAFGSAAQAA